ncbi:MAG: peptidylprolyl isomerase [Bacteroidia bacterium]|nr:peptidylprolyl isomerase [Bacteroidia bacterium]
MIRTFLMSVVLTSLLVACETPKARTDLGEGLFADIETKHGEIILRLAYDKAPLTVANFIGLAEGTIPNEIKPAGEPYFDGMTFHRVEPGFVIQGGDPLANGMGTPGYKFRQEIHPDLSHNVAGTLAMANSGPGTNGSQFYITMAPRTDLDGRYNIFGYVAEGLENVYKVQRNDTILSVRIYRNGEAAKAFDAPAVWEKEK